MKSKVSAQAKTVHEFHVFAPSLDAYNVGDTDAKVDWGHFTPSCRGA